MDTIVTPYFFNSKYDTMKKNLLIISAILILLSITSCTRTLYTHNQVMMSYQTKQDIITAFGLPTEKRKDEGIEEWLYDYGTISTNRGFGNINTNASVYGNGNSAYGSVNTTAGYVTQFNTYTRYVKFTMDNTGRVIRWSSQGVNYAQKKSNPVGTILVVLLTIGAAAGLVIASSSGAQ